MSNQRQLWDRYCRYLYLNRELGISVDISRVRFADSFVSEMAGAMARALAAMADLEAGAIANPDEGRRVGHYWLRDPALAPDATTADEIATTSARIQSFVGDLHSGAITGQKGRFEHVLVIGIGGSALGPQFVADALGSTGDRLAPAYFDNTDPDGIDRTLERLGDALGRTVTVVISKSGGTPETRNGMLEAQAAYQSRGLDFAKHAVAVTQANSKLDGVAKGDGWLARFPMWDWVGGRTSVMSAVGLVPLALQGIDTEQFLAGARAMDRETRRPEIAKNPAALLALMWYAIGAGRGEKDMVILPYKDRLMLFSRYLQQLVMESLGKELDRAGKVVHQGIAVYGNKGSTDQHAYVQQLRDGVPNFFVTFIEVMRDRTGPSIDVEPGVTSGDFLSGLLQGTRRALYEKERDSITLTIEDVSPANIGKLIALYERAVGLYGELIDVNAYHQPGVEAGKTAAAGVIALQGRVLADLSDTPRTAGEIAKSIGAPDEVETVYKILEHLSANPRRGASSDRADEPAKVRYKA